MKKTTNREYLLSSRNEKLAKFLSGSPKICDEMKDYYDEMGDNYKTCCKECALKWFTMEHIQTEIHEGNIKSNVKYGYYMIVKVQKRNSKTMYLDGSFEWLVNEDILADEPTDMTMEEFFEIMERNR